jgi:hypothetical protein
VPSFDACFLLVFGQLAVGGIAALAVPPFAVLERGFYKSSAGVFVGSALLYLAGKSFLVLRTGHPSPGDFVVIGCWAAFTLAASAYLASLWGTDARRRARTYPLALGLGVLALIASASVHRLGPLLSAATLLYPLAFLTGALALGAVGTGMLLGHWYLIDLGLSIEPLRRLFDYFVVTLLLHVGVLVVTLVILGLSRGPAGSAVAALWTEHRDLLGLRLLLGPIAALVLGHFIHRTLLIPQTMAATGLFYIAILFVIVGELLGRLILYQTSLPL